MSVSGTRSIKVDAAVYEQMMCMLGMLGMTPTQFTEEAILAHLHNNREELQDRVQHRLDAYFAKLDTHSPGKDS